MSVRKEQEMTLVRQATSFAPTLLCATHRSLDFELRETDGHEGLKGKKSDDICISNHSSNRLENELEIRNCIEKAVAYSYLFSCIFASGLS